MDLSATKVEEPSVTEVSTKRRVQETKLETVEPAIDVLRSNDINMLYHFTDAANLESIREHGLLSVSSLNQQSLKAVMNSDATSRAVAGLFDFERTTRCNFRQRFA